MGLIARVLEAAGISTVSFFLLAEIAQQLGIPRGLSVKFPFGHVLGEPDNLVQQQLLINHGLKLLINAPQAGTFVQLPYRWKRENWPYLLQAQQADLAQSDAQ